jgi:hypothetical protein
MRIAGTNRWVTLPPGRLTQPEPVLLDDAAVSDSLSAAAAVPIADTAAASDSISVVVTVALADSAAAAGVLTAPTCPCGCGEQVPPTKHNRRFATDSCRKRQHRRDQRARRRELRAANPVACACGCGRMFVLPRSDQRFATRNCAKRSQYRAAKLTAAVPLADRGVASDAICVSVVTALGEPAVALKRCPCPSHEGERLLPASEFYPDRARADCDGLESWCKACSRAKDAARKRAAREAKAVAKSPPVAPRLVLRPFVILPLAQWGQWPVPVPTSRRHRRSSMSASSGVSLGSSRQWETRPRPRRTASTAPGSRRGGTRPRRGRVPRPG